MTIDEDYARRYRETWDKALRRGTSLPEELDREHMLLTRQRRRALIEDLAFDLGEVPPHILAAHVPVALEIATFTDGVRAVIEWLERKAKES